MPFHEVYRVDFVQGNLAPQLNRVGWPDMKLSQIHHSEGSSSIDTLGLTLTITPKTVRNGGRWSAYVESPKSRCHSIPGS